MGRGRPVKPSRTAMMLAARLLTQGCIWQLKLDVLNLLRHGASHSSQTLQHGSVLGCRPARCPLLCKALDCFLLLAGSSGGCDPCLWACMAASTMTRTPFAQSCFLLLPCTWGSAAWKAASPRQRPHCSAASNMSSRVAPLASLTLIDCAQEESQEGRPAREAALPQGSVHTAARRAPSSCHKPL